MWGSCPGVTCCLLSSRSSQELLDELRLKVGIAHEKPMESDEDHQQTGSGLLARSNYTATNLPFLGFTTVDGWLFV